MHRLDINGGHSKDIGSQIGVNVGFYGFSGVEGFAESHDTLLGLYFQPQHVGVVF